ncbi:ABC transporter substrate-binding protein [Nonomuraea gerenzanensis]|uniref:Probable secreted solute-binding protein n=1 Tax=Nonomuraea gerenzanensis TaxID=93944 RepID=A0A1M4EIS2_9ACTN|nr:sugar ABC transporter substrate-binding protein [Nonomuraea gerenzanensis]UBU10421.1 sugar ABC transporter substrate-binding protein [Nonomuraea gerenzanensis]SBO98817.1 probable secreted solute-binding protein [Nonomuraea gerenzanensis]
MRNPVLVATATVVTLLLTGCGSGSSGQPGEIRLRMIESLTGPERTKLIKSLLADFERANPGVTVELISPPLDSADQKITQILQTKKGLDVLEVRDHTAKSFSNNGWLAELPTTEWAGWPALTELAQKKAVEVGGKAYLIPYGFYQRTLFYRTDFGMTAPPATWQELYEAGKRMTTGDRYGYSFRGGKGGADYAVMMISAYNGDQLNPEKSFYLKDKRTIFSTPEAAQALDLFVKIFKEASPPDSVSWGYPEMVQGFTSGVTGMLIQDPEVIKTVEESGVTAWSTAPIPKGPTGYAYQPVGYAGWGVTSFSEHPAEAVKLVQFLSEAEQSIAFAKGNSLIPISKEAQNDPQFSQGAWKAYLQAQQDPKQVITIRPVDYPGWSQFLVDSDRDVQSLITGKKGTAEVLKAWDAFWVDQAKKVS